LVHLSVIAQQPKVEEQLLPVFAQFIIVGMGIYVGI